MSASGAAPHAALIRHTRFILVAGFGGLLLLMGLAGLDTLRALREIQARNEVIRSEFLARNRLLNQIRSDLYLSGTYVRDYLLEPDPGHADAHRASLERARADMDAALKSYAARLERGELAPYQVLRAHLDDYWRVLEPVFHWSAQERRTHGFPFLGDEVYPRRTAMLGLADQIAAFNEQQLNQGNAHVAELFSGFRFRSVATLLLSLGLGWLMASLSIGKILQLERELSGRYRQIEQARAESKELSARLVAAQENERRAISRELHDEVGQSLSALLVGLSNLSAALPEAARPAVREQMAGIRALAENSVAVVRNMALLLRPSMLDDLGLVPALQWQARETSRNTGIEVNVAAEEVSDDLPEEHKTCIYRVVQEALHNCARHSGARRVQVAVTQNASGIVVTIEDDGCGFDPAAQKGLGLLGIQERVSSLGGALQVDAQRGRGALLAMTLPLINHNGDHPNPAG